MRISLTKFSTSRAAIIWIGSTSTKLLSGALFQLDHLPKVLMVLTTLDPLSYGVDGLRVALIGATRFGVARDLLVLTFAALATLCLGAWRFSDIEL